MKTIIKICLTIISAPVLCFSQWSTALSITELNQNSICYPGENNILIACDSGIIIRSTDLGSNWTSSSLKNGASIRAIHFVDSYNGFLAGDSGIIYRTENLGEEWTDVSIDFYFHLKDIKFKDNLNGIVVGTKQVRIDGRTHHLPSIHTTTNAGGNWFEHPFNFSGRLSSVAYIDQNNIITVGDSGLILISTDNGNGWSTENLNTTSDLNKVMSYEENTVVISGNDGTLFYSNDSGYNWNSVDIPFYYHIIGACITPAIELVMACSKEVRVDGRTFFMATIISYDFNSNTWREDFSQIRGKYNDLVYCGNNIAYAIGDSGIIAYYNSPTRVNTYGDNLPSAFTISQNYPNPFNPSTVINYQLPLSGSVTLKVYDLLGREIAALVNEEKPAGSYEVEFDASQLSSGVYIYRLTAGSFSATNKMTLLK
jgi:hypothetical protein